MFTADQYDQARAVADTFNRSQGGQLLKVIEAPPEKLTFADLRALAAREPGDYLAANVFQAVKGRRPTHIESIKLGQMLGALTVARKKHGAATLWRLDKAFAERAH